MWVALKRVSFFGAEIRLHIWIRWTELVQMLEVTTTSSHAGSRIVS